MTIGADHFLKDQTKNRNGNQVLPTKQAVKYLMDLTDRLALAKDKEEFDRILAEQSFDQEQCRSLPEPAQEILLPEPEEQPERIPITV
jgi:hypothetical protein